MTSRTVTTFTCNGCGAVTRGGDERWFEIEISRCIGYRSLFARGSCVTLHTCSTECLREAFGKWDTLVEIGELERKSEG